MEQRKRVNAKQNAKGEWQIDVTVEWTGENLATAMLAADHLALVKAMEAEYKADGRKLAGE